MEEDKDKAHLKITFSLHPPTALGQFHLKQGTKVLASMPVSHWMQANNAEMNLLVIIASL